MPEALVIVESPAKAKTIGKYLGRDYIVKASMGHVRDLPRSQMGVDIENGFEPKYITIRGKGKILKELREAAKKAKNVYLAADPDREGEAIAWHLAHSLEIDAKSRCRVVFNEITEKAVTDAFKQPRQINMDLVNAQQARRILDRLVGYKISPLLWKKVKKGLSAGRVQSVAVKLIIDREKEIKAFVPEEYWSITAHFKKNGEGFEAKFYGWDGEKQTLSNSEEVQQVLKKIDATAFVVKSVQKKERKRNPVPPFITSTLQQEAARKLNFKAAKTMMLAQQLYEGIDLGPEGSTGLITYMRTDSTRVSETAKEEAAQYITQHFGQDYLGQKRRTGPANRRAQDAHEAIRPTDVMNEPGKIKEYLTRDQFRLYKLIWERYVASQMAPALMDAVTADIAIGEATFRATGSKVNFPGFMKVYIEGTDEVKQQKERFLPPLSEGQRLKRLGINPEQHFTQPPPRYTEARLVKAMEELGIGRPSTYAPTLETIQKRWYVRLEERRFVSTELGEIVVELMEQFFPEIINVEFTAKMEEQLDEIEEGQVDWVEILDAFYKQFSERLAIAEKEMEKIQVEEEVSDEKCEKCNRPMVYKFGRYGRFLACSGFPECRNAKPILKTIGVKCPKCKQGEIVERKSSKRRRTFYGCDQYPDCDFVSWDKPINRPCPKCQSLLVEKKASKRVVIRCTQCDYEEADA